MKTEKATDVSQSKDLQKRLRRISKSRTREPKTPPITIQRGSLPPGEEIKTKDGIVYRIEKTFDRDFIHGEHNLRDLDNLSPELNSEIYRYPEFQQLSQKDLLFLDLETTSLAGGAGAMAFLVGVGIFDERGFHLRQYFLRDPAEESGMLGLLEKDLEAANAFVSFNGKTFDVPLLEMRYMISRRKRWRLTEFPQMDLLFPSRRLWNRQLPDCRLSTIERRILKVKRTDEDVPGELIPGMYLDYLRTGKSEEMSRVLYHNEMDLLSMVALAIKIQASHQPEDLKKLSASEKLAVGRWHQEWGRESTAEEVYRLATSSRTPQDIRIDALRRFTKMLRRAGRREEAVKGWETWYEISPSDHTPCIELAKFYEWQLKDPLQALDWAKQALVALSHEPEDWRRDRAWDEVEHRIRRLTRKLDKAADK